MLVATHPPLARSAAVLRRPFLIWKVRSREHPPRRDGAEVRSERVRICGVDASPALFVDEEDEAMAARVERRSGQDHVGYSVRSP